MRVFVTGATGFVGAATVQELLRAGHAVTGLARSDAKAQELRDAGATALRGDLDDLEVLRKGAADADGVIHLGFNHDFSKFEQNCAQDKLAIETLGGALEGTARPLIVTSGLAFLPKIGAGYIVESSEPAPTFLRKSEFAAQALVDRGVNVSLVRLAPSVHGDGDHGFVPLLIGLARKTGKAAYIGDGLNRWPGVHRLDAAKLYRQALERAEAGAKYHATDELGVPFKDIAAVIGKHLAVPVVSLAEEAAAVHFEWFVHFAGMDAAASSEVTRKTLGWRPEQRGLLDDLEQGTYFSVR